MPVILPAPDLPAGPRSALVVATGTYTDATLAKLRSPARDAQDLAAVLADPQIAGFSVTVLADPQVQALRVGIEEFLAGRAAEEIVLVYLSCHGVLDARRRLYFAANNTRQDRLASTAVEARWLTDLLDDCRARRQVVVLDCCFSGAFAHTKAGPGARDVGLDTAFAVPEGRGRVVLTASRATEYSFEGRELADGSTGGSVFTAALVEGLRTGDADGDHDGLIGVSDLYAYAHARIAAAGMKQTPQRWMFGAEGEITLARSPAGCQVAPAELTDEIRAALDSRSPRVRAAGVAELGDWLTDPDPRRVAAARLGLERIVSREHPDVSEAARTLLQACDVRVHASETLRLLGLAEHLSGDVRDPNDQAWLLALIAQEAVGTIASGRAVELVARARGLATLGDRGLSADTVTVGMVRAWSALSVAAAGIHPERSGWIQRALVAARSMPGGSSGQYEAHANVAVAVAGRDPDLAEAIVNDMPVGVGPFRDWVLAEIAAAVAGSDPERAKRLLEQADEHRGDDRLGAYAVAHAALRPDRVEKIVAALADPGVRVRVLTAAAAAMIAANPVGATDLARRAEGIAATMHGAPDRVVALVHLARLHAQCARAGGQQGR